MSEEYDEEPPEIDYSEEDDEYLDEETENSTVLELLEKYKHFLSVALKSNEISQEEFNIQMLMTTYELDTKSKTYVLSDVDKEAIDELIFYKKQLIKEYEGGKIDVDNFNSLYGDILKKELVILKRNYKLKRKKTSEVSLPLKTVIKKIQTAEDSMIKKIMQKYSIEYPIKPSGYTDDDIKRYIYRVSFNYKLEEIEMDEVLDDYLKKLAEFKKLINYHMDSFVLSKKIMNDVSGKFDYEFEHVESISHKFDELKKSALEKVDFLSYNEKFITNRLKNLKNLMREMGKKMGKASLIRCAMKKLDENFTLIEKLKVTRARSLKFKDFEFEVEGVLSNTKLEVCPEYVQLWDSTTERPPTVAPWVSLYTKYTDEMDTEEIKRGESDYTRLLDTEVMDTDVMDKEEIKRGESAYQQFKKKVPDYKKSCIFMKKSSPIDIELKESKRPDYMLDGSEFRLKSGFLRQSEEGIENLARETQGFNQRLEELIREDLDIYKVTYEDIYEPFDYTFYDIYEDRYYGVQGEVMPYYALDVQGFSLVLPFSQDITLESETGKNSEVVDTWILKKPDGVTTRFLSFEKYLYTFKEQLIQELKEIEIKENQIKTSEKTRKEQEEKTRKEQEERDRLIASGEKSDVQLVDVQLVDEPMREELPLNVNKQAVSTNERFQPQRWMAQLVKGKSPSSIKRKLLSEEGEENKSFKKRETNVFLRKRAEFLRESIKEINHYLEFNFSIEKSSQTAQLLPGEISQLRRKGIIELHKYISEPGGDKFVENIWDNIFKFSTLNYKKNMEKIIFIFINFPDKLNELIAGEIHIKELLTFETPLVTPPNDLIAGTWNEEAKRVFLKDEDISRNIQTLLQWRPSTDMYEKYETELNFLNHDFKLFKSRHPESTHLEIREIMSQYAEKIQWESTLSSYKKLEVPTGRRVETQSTGRTSIKWPGREVYYDISLNFRLRWLIKKRNQLPSRRQYILASIETRVEKLKELTDNFKRCEFKNANELASIVETSIYTLSKTPEDYMYYIYIVNTNFTKFCKILKQKESLIGLDNFKELIIFIVKYISSSGEIFQFSRLGGETMIPTNKTELEAYVKGLMVLSDIDRGNPKIDVEVEKATLALNAIQLQDSEDIEDEQFLHRLNTYIPPTITTVPPMIGPPDEGGSEQINIEQLEKELEIAIQEKRDREDRIIREQLIQLGFSTIENFTTKDLLDLAVEFGIDLKKDAIQEKRDREYIKTIREKLIHRRREYIRVGNTYIYGGYFPPFYKYIKKSNPEELGYSKIENFTTEDLVNLASVFGIDLKKDGVELSNLELYTSIISFMDTYKSTTYRSIIVRPVYYHVELKKEEYLKIPVKNIKYTTRVRLNVKPPGQVYPVYEDKYFKYGVPIKFNEHTIPIYPRELIIFLKEKFIKIEGPYIFLEEEQTSFFDLGPYMSNFYIMVEYRNFRGDKTFCREGVAVKKIIRKVPSEFLGCDRYKNEEDCNDPFSFSMETDIYDVNKQKKSKIVYKCGWDSLKGICTGLIPSNSVEEFDIESVYFGDNRDEVWRLELKNYREILESSIKEKGIVDIKEAEKEALEQKTNLFLKFKELLDKSTDVSAEVPMEEIPSTELLGESKKYSSFYENLVNPAYVDFSLKAERNAISLQLKEGILRREEDFRKQEDFRRQSGLKERNPGRRPPVLKDTEMDEDLMQERFIFDTDTTLYAYKIKEPPLKGYKEVTVYMHKDENVDGEVRISLKPRYCLVANEDYAYPSKKDKLYYWIQRNVEYVVGPAPGLTGDTLLRTTKSRLIIGFPPPNSIKLNPGGDEMYGKRIITLAEIQEAMFETAFKTFETSESDKIMQFKDVGILVPVVIDGWQDNKHETEEEKEEKKAKLQAEWDQYSDEEKYFKSVGEYEKSIADAIKLAETEESIHRLLIRVQPDAIKLAIEHKIDIISLFNKQKFRDKLMFRMGLDLQGRVLPQGLLDGAGFILSGEDKDLTQILKDRPETKIISINELKDQIQKALNEKNIEVLYQKFALGLEHLMDIEDGEVLMKSVSVFLKENEQTRKEREERYKEEKKAADAAYKATTKRPTTSYLSGGGKFAELRGPPD